MTNQTWEQDPFGGKLYPLEDLRKKVEALKAQGRKVILSNGTFDLLHVGHIRALRHARSLGDCLILAVNSDDSVKKYKGAHLPVVSEKERLEVLSSLDMVDYLVLFGETSVSEVLLALKPHVHAKGRDYSQETVPERDTVLSYGGEIAIVGDPKDHSTTSLIDRVQNLKTPESIKDGGENSRREK